MVSKNSNPPIAKKPAKVLKPVAKAKASDPNDMTPPDFLHRSKNMTKEQIAQAKEAADRLDRSDNTITWVPPTTAPKAPASGPKKAVKTGTEATKTMPKDAKTPKQLAAELGTNDRALRRTLRALVKAGKIEHAKNGRWEITPAEMAIIKAAV